MVVHSGGPTLILSLRISGGSPRWIWVVVTKVKGNSTSKSKLKIGSLLFTSFHDFKLHLLIDLVNLHV
ncbi:hypothetical protein HanRHA438_Chr01g0015401 [Helianthus annuus]|nr:hypothetical protein HanRHA438_Chr01g0015401 [Helianthus annuus]